MAQNLWMEPCVGQQARELLAPLYGWFTDSRRSQEAKALLKELA
jgi:hypothetical protein